MRSLRRTLVFVNLRDCLDRSLKRLAEEDAALGLPMSNAERSNTFVELPDPADYGRDHSGGWIL